jgi:hypothetical protein
VPNGTAFICSANQGTLMEEEKPGLFVAELIKEMRSPGSTVEDVFKRTRMDVLRGSNSKQAPWYSSTLEEEFIFSAPAGRPTATQARTDPAPAAKPQVSPPPAPTKPESMPDDKIATPAPRRLRRSRSRRPTPTPRGTNRSGNCLLGARHHRRSLRRTEGLQRGAAAFDPATPMLTTAAVWST